MLIEAHTSHSNVCNDHSANPFNFCLHFFVFVTDIWLLFSIGHRQCTPVFDGTLWIFCRFLVFSEIEEWVNRNLLQHFFLFRGTLCSITSFALHDIFNSYHVPFVRIIRYQLDLNYSELSNEFIDMTCYFEIIICFEPKMFQLAYCMKKRRKIGILQAYSGLLVSRKKQKILQKEKQFHRFRLLALYF